MKRKSPLVDYASSDDSDSGGQKHHQPEVQMWEVVLLDACEGRTAVMVLFQVQQVGGSQTDVGITCVWTVGLGGPSG